MSLIKSRGKFILALLLSVVTCFVCANFSAPIRANASTTEDLTYTISYDANNVETPWRFVGNGKDIMCDEFSTVMSNIDDARYKSGKYQDVTLIFDNQYIPHEMTFDKGNYIIKAPQENGVALGYKNVQGDFFYNNENNLTINEVELASLGIRVSNGAKVTFKDCQAYVSDLQLGSSNSDVGEIVFDNSTYYLPHLYLSNNENKLEYQTSLINDYDNEGVISFINGSTFSNFNGNYECEEEQDSIYNYFTIGVSFGDGVKGYTGNLKFINSYLDDTMWVHTTKDLYVENLSIRYTDVWANEEVARLIGERNTTIAGDVNFAHNNNPYNQKYDFYVSVKSTTNLIVSNLTTNLLVLKETSGYEHEDIVAKGDRNSLELLTFETNFNNEVYNDLPIEEVVIEQLEEDTYKATLNINYFVVYVGFDSNTATKYYVQRGKTLLEELDGIINKEKPDYYISKNNYSLEYPYENIGEVDVATFIPTKQYSTLKIYYSPIIYEIKYENLKGAYLNPQYIDRYNKVDVTQIGKEQHVPSKNVLLNLPSENEYIFDGWSYTLNGPKITVSDITITESLARGFTLYARWINVYTVTIDSLNGEEPTIQYVQDGKLATAPTQNPVLDKYEFLNWYDSSDETKQEFNFNKGITSNVTIKANWLRIWEVTFDASDAEEVGREFDQETKKLVKYVRDGEQITDHIVKPTKSDEKFVYWYDIDEGEDVPFDLGNINKDVTLKIKWETKTYNITFEHTAKDEAFTNWPQKIENVQIHASIQEPVLTECPEGYEFDYWSNNGVAFDFSDVKHTDYEIVLTARWKYIEYKIDFVTTLPNGEEPMVIANNYVSIYWVESELKYRLPELVDMDFAPDSEFRYYDFKGFALKPDATESDVITSYNVTKYNYNNMPTFYAVWEIKQFTITFDKTGSEDAMYWPNNITVDALTVIDNFPIPTKNGYNFVGWSYKDGNDAPSTITVDRNYTFVAQWEEDNYFIYYITTLPNGAVGPTLNYNGVTGSYTLKDTYLILPNSSAFAFIPTGYKFKGWVLEQAGTPITTTYFDLSAIYPCRDLYFYAYWEEKTYTVEFSLTDGKSSSYIVEIDEYTGKDYFASTKNSSNAGIYKDEGTNKLLINVSNKNHNVILPAPNNLFVNDGTKYVTGYKIGDTVLSNLELRYSEIVEKADTTDRVYITPIFEKSNVYPWIADTTTYGTSAVSYGWCVEPAAKNGIFFVFDNDKKEYSILRKEYGSQNSFDTEYFDYGSYSFELVVFIDDVSLNSINSYSDLEGFRYVKFQQITQVQKGRLIYDGLAQANIASVFTYDGEPHKPYWAGNANSHFATAITVVGEEQVNAGYYNCKIVVSNPNYDLYYADYTLAGDYINFTWRINTFSLTLGTEHLIYNGGEQKITLSQLVRNSGEVPNWEESLKTAVITCEGARVEGDCIYVTNVGEYIVELELSSNYGYNREEGYIGIIVGKKTINTPKSNVKVGWKANGNQIELSDFFTTDVSNIVKITDDTQLNPNALGIYEAYFELINDNYKWGNSGGGGFNGGYIGGGRFNGGSANEEDGIVTVSWELEARKINYPRIKFYTSETAYDLYNVDGPYYYIPGQFDLKDDFEYRIEFNDSSYLDYCSIQNPTYSSAPGNREAIISLLYPEFTIWTNGSWVLNSPELNVSWYLERHITYVPISFEYWFDNNNQPQYRVVILDEQYSHLEYDVEFINYSLDNGGYMGGMMGGLTTYVNEFPPFVAGENHIYIEVVFRDSDYEASEYNRDYSINYNPQNNDQDDSGNQGGGAGGGAGGDVGGGPDLSDAGCAGSPVSTIGGIATLLLMYVAINLGKGKLKKKKC